MTRVIRPRAEIADVIRAYTGARAPLARAAADAVMTLIVERYRIPQRRIWTEGRKKVTE